MNISFGKSDFDIGLMEGSVDYLVELALHPGKAFARSKLVNSSTHFFLISARKYKTEGFYI